MNVTRTARAGEDLVVLYNEWILSAGGNEMKGKAIEIVRRQPDGTWLFAIDDPFARG
jgi:ketosteroid isomerase-like protein